MKARLPRKEKKKINKKSKCQHGVFFRGSINEMMSDFMELAKTSKYKGA